jgi:hypothetical protein
VQAEDANGSVFRTLELSDSQKAQLGQLWKQWEARRRALDSELSAALAALDALPHVTNIPTDFALRVSQISTGAAKPPCCPYRSYERSGSGGRRSEDCHGSCAEGCDSEWGRGFIGASGATMQAADAAVAQLLNVHGEDAAALEEVLAALLVPSSLISPVQVARLCTTQLEESVSLSDVLWICRAAAFEHGRKSVFNIFTKVPCPVIERAACG